MSFINHPSVFNLYFTNLNIIRHAAESGSQNIYTIIKYTKIKLTTVSSKQTFWLPEQVLAITFYY